MTPDDLRAIRRALGLSQEGLAAAVGVHRVTVARWELGTHHVPPPVERLMRRLLAEQDQTTATPSERTGR